MSEAVVEEGTEPTTCGAVMKYEGTHKRLLLGVVRFVWNFTCPVCGTKATVECDRWRGLRRTKGGETVPVEPDSPARDFACPAREKEDALCSESK